MAELCSAAAKEEWDQVEVRRPLEAVVCSQRGPSRAVPVGLGQYPLQPSSHAGFVTLPDAPPDVETRPEGNR